MFETVNRRKPAGRWRIVWFIPLLCALAVAQTSTPTSGGATPQKSSTGATSQQKPPNQSADSAQEPKISPKEAEELFRSVDEILKFASKDSGRPIKHEVKRRLTSRDEVEAYLEKNMAEDKDAQRLRRSELVLKKFGLLPRDFDLQKFLVALLREQVAGYYDPKTQTVNLLDWVGAEQQKPVLAHELTHALQDQSFGLEKFMKAGDIDLDTIPQPTWEDLQKDELTTARQAVVEGQAMVVLVDYMLAPLGQTIMTSRPVVDALKQGMLVGTDQSPQFQNAPLFLKEALTFPYRYGIDFAAELLTAGGKQKAFAGAFENPPRSTRDIMEPKTYLAGEKIPPMPLPDFASTFKNYDRFDVGAMGEFDVALLVDQYAGVDESHAIYPKWRGGYYYSVKPKGDPSAPLGLMYASRWAQDADAQSFAAIYAKSLTARYQRAREAVEEGKPEVNLKTVGSLTGTHTWLTEEGPVVIEVEGDDVLITESLDPATTEKLQQQLLQPTATSSK